MGRKKGTLLQTYITNAPVKSVAISQDGRYIVSTSGENIKLWDRTKQGKPIKEFIGGVNGNWAVFDNINKKLFRGDNGNFLIKKQRF